jgi:hypothetical protein
MNKIIFATATAVAMFAFSSTAEASRTSQNTQYSQHEEVSFDPIGDLLGGPEKGWSVMTPINRRVKHSAYHSKRYSTYSHHYSGPISASIVSYGHMLQHMGLRVSEHPAFGGVHHVHHGWAHYSGRAIDVNVGRGVYEAHSGYSRKFDAIAARARAAGYTVLWRVAGHFDHMHIQK